MNIGLIGTGNIGGCLARKLSGTGHRVLLANSRGPESLSGLAAEIGATAVVVTDLARKCDIVILSVPMKSILELSAHLFDDASGNLIIVDTCNYIPMRDGRIEPLENGLAESRWVEQRLGRPVVKAFNNIGADSLANDGHPKGSRERFALPVAGDDKRAKDIVVDLIEEIGFDGFDASGLDESWRQQPGSPAFCTNLEASRLAAVLQRLDEVDRARLPELRDAVLQKFMQLPNTPVTRDTVLLIFRSLAGL
jgi:hypothetical protein